jgi:flagellar protein FliO/FliZ
MDVAKKVSPPPAGPVSGHRPASRVRSSWWVVTITFAFLFLLSAAVLPAQEQKKEDPVIYPRGSAPADAPAQARASGPSATSYLAIALLAGAAGWWLWIKRRGGVRGTLAGTAKLAIAESKSLGSRQYLVVADYDGKKFLLGVCPGSIELLTPLDGEKAKDA